MAEIILGKLSQSPKAMPSERNGESPVKNKSQAQLLLVQ